MNRMFGFRLISSGITRGSSGIARGVFAILFVAFLNGSACVVAYCDEDCDPCVSDCKCSGSCDNDLVYDFGTVHRLSAYNLTSKDDPETERERTFSDIVGLSLDFAHGPVEHSAADCTRFARGVIDANDRLLAPEGRRWTPEPVEVFQTAFVVPFRGENARERLDFLLDRRGNLVEIRQVLQPDP